MTDVLTTLPIILFWGFIACVTLAAVIWAVSELYYIFGKVFGRFEVLEDNEGTTYLRRK